MVPTWAYIKAKIDKPDNWDEMDADEQKSYFAEHMDVHASLCHQCTEGMECDFELDDKEDYEPHFSEEE